MDRIYLDNAATTPIDPAVAEAVRAAMAVTGNASSLHRAGVAAATLVERSRNTIASRINADPACLVFTSGGTEANNLAITGAVVALREKGDHLVTCAVEHPSVLNTFRRLERFGFRLTVLPVDAQGFVSPDDVKKALTPKTVLVSVMHANNEIGTIQPVGEIGRLCRERGVLFHTDACQSFTKVPLDVEAQSLDMVSLNAHKLHGPHGIGALYVRKGITLEPLSMGGGQEGGLRPGTMNTEGIAGFAKAVELMNEDAVRTMAALRDGFIAQVCALVPGTELNGPLGKDRLCSNVSLTFPKGDGKELFSYLNKKGIMISLGSACASTKDTPSHVLLAIGRTPEEARRSVRVSLSRFTTVDEVEPAGQAIADSFSEGR